MSRRNCRELRDARTPAPRPRRLRAGLLLAAAAIAVAAVTLWAAMHRRPPAPAPPAMLSATALRDSMVAADLEQDWARVGYWLQRLRESDPGDPSYQLALGMAWHNLTWVGTPSARERSATRTSLGRITMEKRVLALMDSSTANARSPRQWAQAQFYAATLHENLGLVTDALRIYTGVHMRTPGTTAALARAAALMGHLRDPQPPAAPAAAPVAADPAQP